MRTQGKKTKHHENVKGQLEGSLIQGSSLCLCACVCAHTRVCVCVWVGVCVLRHSLGRFLERALQIEVIFIKENIHCLNELSASAKVHTCVHTQTRTHTQAHMHTHIHNSLYPNTLKNSVYIRVLV